MKKNKYIWLILVGVIIIAGILITSMVNSYLTEKHKNELDQKHMVIKKDLQWTKDNAYFEIDINVKEKKYELYIIGEGERKYQQVEDTDLGEKDDTIVTGDFAFYLWTKEYGKKAVKQDLELPNPMTFNLSQKNIGTFLVNQQNIAAVYQGKEANEVMAYFYTIHDGKLVTLTDYGMRIYSKNIKNIQQNYIQTLREKDTDQMEFDTWMLEQKSGKLVKVDGTSIKNKEIINKWLDDTEFYYPYKNLSVTSSLKNLAEQGMLIGAQYPIGTNIKEIKKINSNYTIKDYNQKYSQLDFPEITYYYDKKTDLVTSISIPGIRLKESVQSIQDTIGKPDDFVTKEAGSIATYTAGNYKLIIQLDLSQRIKSISLVK
ncbi:DUF4309 domain-containing protein [Niallia circulans]|uniref:DUF4309 domain-containing protein n=1 Tax=Niallia circulans TaxID=1397 RepID=A0AA91Z0Z3_NIACI|nr:DUF4309 domain-containing protein [Niallia circulans]PAD82806.1 hypothetical protein CHH57_12900 [Niallia circulans]UQZ74624.1 DUF4309 domain-containing protein [Niallia circulans]